MHVIYCLVHILLFIRGITKYTIAQMSALVRRCVSYLTRIRSLKAEVTGKGQMSNKIRMSYCHKTTLVDPISIHIKLTCT